MAKSLKDIASMLWDRAQKVVPQVPSYPEQVKQNFGRMFNPAPIQQYVQGQIVNPIKQGVKEVATSPGFVNKAIGGAKILGGGFSAIPIGAMYNLAQGTAAGVGRSLRTGQPLQSSIQQGITQPTSFAQEGIGVKNPLLALGIDVIAGNPRGAVSSLKNVKNLKDLRSLRSMEGLSPNAYTIHPEDEKILVDIVGKLQSKVKLQPTESKTLQLLADHYLGKRYSVGDNKKIANAFDYLLAKKNQGVTGQFPKPAYVVEPSNPGTIGNDMAGQTDRIPPPVVDQATVGKTQLPPKSSVQQSMDGGPQIPGGSSSGGSIPPTDPVQKVIQALKEAKPLRGKQEAIYAKIRSRQAGAVAGVGKTVPGEAGFHAQLGQLKGGMPKVTFESIREQIGQKDIDSLFDKVEQNNILSPFEKVTAKSGLAKLLGAEGGNVPQKGELKLLNEIFPPEFIESIIGKKPLMEKLWGVGENVLNLPRSMMATADLSAPLRQGVFLIGRPKQWVPATKEMFKYAFSENAYKGLQENIQARPTYKLMREAKLAITDMGPLLGTREEAFMSNLAERIPGFGRIAKGSNRAYSGFLNKLRADTFDDLVKSAQKQGVPVEGKVLDDIAKFVNAATGRGDLGALTRSAPILTNVFFSPRLMASRLNLLNPVFYAKLDPMVRKEALKSLLTFAGTGLTVVGLAKLAGAEVGADPRSADFGKIKIGNTRYDIWGGFQQYMRAAGQLITGQYINTATGKELSLGEGYNAPTRLDIIQRFFESKSSPVAAFALALLKGKTNMGDDLNVPVEIADMFIPLVAQSMYDLYKEDENNGIFKSLPGVFGVGVQTYTDKIPMQGQTPGGKPNVQWRQAPGLGETLLNKATGTKISNIPPEEWQTHRDIKDLKSMKKLEMDKIKKQVLETGKPQSFEGKNVFLKNGVVTTEGEESSLIERMFGIKKAGAAEESSGINFDKEKMKMLKTVEKEKFKMSDEPFREIGNNIVLVREGESIKEVDTAFQPKAPVKSGEKEIDKLRYSKFGGEVTKKKNDIMQLLEAGVIPEEEAVKQLNSLIAMQKKVSNTGSGGGRKVKISRSNIRVPNIKISLPAPKRVKIKALKKLRVAKRPKKRTITIK